MSSAREIAPAAFGRSSPSQAALVVIYSGDGCRRRGIARAVAANQSVLADVPLELAHEGNTVPNTADGSNAPVPRISLADFQQLIRRMYYDKDVARGIDGTFMWLMEEVGELAAALRGGTVQERMEEFADVLAWLATIANVAGVDLSQAVARKYGAGCPGCGLFVCTCDGNEKP